MMKPKSFLHSQISYHCNFQILPLLSINIHFPNNLPKWGNDYTCLCAKRKEPMQSRRLWYGYRDNWLRKVPEDGGKDGSQSLWMPLPYGRRASFPTDIVRRATWVWVDERHDVGKFIPRDFIFSAKSKTENFKLKE